LFFDALKLLQKKHKGSDVIDKREVLASFPKGIIHEGNPEGKSSKETR
jgi:hypothetical protein